MLQGVWEDEETDEVLFKLQGDSVYYPDSTSMPAYSILRNTANMCCGSRMATMK